MHFVVQKRKQTPAVIIVALIDVLIVLVIFLLVTTTFKQQSSLKLALPESSQAKKPGANENPPLVVSIDANEIFQTSAADFGFWVRCKFRLHPNVGRDQFFPSKSIRASILG
jgi:biopolymer transport protein ExbD